MERRASCLGIVTGLAVEASPWSAFAGTRACAVRTGLGRDAAAHAAAQCIAAGATALMSFGIAGGLAPHHGPGTVVVASTVVSDRLPAITCDPAWTTQILRDIKRQPVVISAPLADTSSIVATPADKSRLYEITGAVAVDMESYGIGEVAAARGLPFAAVRVVADGAHDRIPAAALQAMAPDGTLRLAGTILNILRNPGDIPAIMTLGFRTRGALRQLRGIAQTSGLALMPQ